MPVTGVRMPTNYPQEGHWKLDYLRPEVQSDRAAASSHRARAQRVHQRRLPWHPHAYRAALRVIPASKFSERYLSFPPNFTTFGHFLKPTTTWNVLTKPSSTLLWEKNLAPSKVGLNRKRSDFSDLPNGLNHTCRGMEWLIQWPLYPAQVFALSQPNRSRDLCSIPGFFDDSVINSEPVRLLFEFLLLDHCQECISSAEAYYSSMALLITCSQTCWRIVVTYNVTNVCAQVEPGEWEPKNQQQPLRLPTQSF